jgi:hypothetical protein
MLIWRREDLYPMGSRGFHREDRSADLALLVYELLDAHDDTVRLGNGPENDLRWRAHLEYLRGLQRVGRETLARATSGDCARPTRWRTDVLRRFRRPASDEVATS